MPDPEPVAPELADPDPEAVPVEDEPACDPCIRDASA